MINLFVKFIRLCLTAIISTLLFGCSSITYYSQAVTGQLEILQNREPIKTLVASGQTNALLDEQLQYALRLRTFASDSLGLPDNNSYRYYADLGREYVVWNVFATPALSLENRQWCFLVAGCLNYRGYFSYEGARQLAIELEHEGYDVFVGGVRAYSTLGWFDDPLLNTMMNGDRAALAEVIFHELAHQQLFVQNDTEFNEAFAEAVAQTGVRRWLHQHGSTDELLAYEARKRQEAEFVSLVMRYRASLAAVYVSNTTVQVKQREKERLLREMTEEYREQRVHWTDTTRYDEWFARGVNNAKVSAIATYRQYLPGFEAVMQAVNASLPEFYRRVSELSRCDVDKRKRILLDQVTDFTCPA